MIYPREVKHAIELLEQNGFEAYVVGGCLRNILMGKEPKDWDMTTSALPEACSEVFGKRGYHVIETGLKHGTVTVLIDGLPIEITTFRIDGEYSDSRHPDRVVFSSSLSEDLARRDFTVNAMAYSEKTGLVDLYGGKDDLEKGILRAVGEPERRFSEDALRILRAFRFSSEHGFAIEEATRIAIMKCGGGLKSISRERIYSELCRMLMGDSASSAVSSLIACGLMPFIFAEYDSSFRPKTEVLDRLPKKLVPRLACFLMGFAREKAETALTSLKPSNAEKSDVKEVFSAYERLSGEPFGDVVSARRFIGKFGENGIYAVKLSGLFGSDVSGEEKAIAAALSVPFPRRISELAIGGSEVGSLGAKGRRIGEVLSFLLEKTTENPSLNTAKALTELAKKYISEEVNGNKRD